MPVLRNVMKYGIQCTNLNCRQDRSGRAKTGRSAEKIGNAREILQASHSNVCGCMNGFGLPRETFSRITRLELDGIPTSK